MKQQLLDITQNFIEREALFTTNDRLLLAISGGIDSVCLAYVLRELGYDFDLIHVNFQLRGAESDGDQAFVERLAEKLDVGLRLQSSNSEEQSDDQRRPSQANTKEITAKSNQSLQEVARQIRYDFFEKTATSESYDYVLTAHHLEDNLETTLLNLMRGTGIYGLTGIPAKRGIYRRPFLAASRVDIENYAAVNHLLWREDASNASDNYRRNHLRHHVLPGLKSLDKAWSNQLTSTYQNLRRDRDLIHYSLTKTFEETLDEQGNIIKAKLPSDPKIAEQLLKHNLSKHGFSGDQFRQMITAKNGSEIIAPSGTISIKTNPDLLVLLKNKPSLEKASQLGTDSEKTLLITADFATLKFSNNQTITFTEIARPDELATNNPNVIYLSKSAAPLPWTLRHPRPGDHFQPFGMSGKSKKLQDFFTDLKLPSEERKNQWLLCDEAGTILWILGLRASELGRIKQEERSVVKVTISQEKQLPE